MKIPSKIVHIFWWLRSRLSRYGFLVERIQCSSDLLELLWKMQPVNGGYDLVRLGSAGDGGYLVPNDLEGISALFSPGVADNISFEQDALGHGLKVFLADASVKEELRVPDGMHFIPKYVGVNGDEITFRLDEWVDSLVSHDEDLMLQMDIEGSEWSVLLDCPEIVLNRFRIMVIEFHRVDLILVPEIFSIYSAVWHKLLKNFSISHLHINNFGYATSSSQASIPPLIEVTWHRKDRIVSEGDVLSIPHPLDEENSKLWSTVKRSGVWFQS